MQGKERDEGYMQCSAGRIVPVFIVAQFQALDGVGEVTSPMGPAIPREFPSTDLLVGKRQC